MSIDPRRACLFIALPFAALTAGCAVPQQDTSTAMHTLDHGPLKSGEVMAFAVVRDAATARAFYEGTLGLTILAVEPAALMLDSGGTVIRLQIGPNHQPEKYTVLGWKVPDIRATASRLADAGVKVERFEWMTIQDGTGIATFPNGDMVAWFKDPDGNILGVAQLK